MPKPNGGKGGNSGDGGNPNPITIAGQLQLLNDIQVIEFACSPATVQPFQTTVVSYAVEPLPIGLDLPVTFSINGNKVGTGHSGSFSFSVNTDTTFKLLAANKVTSADIATTQVTVDPSQCSPGTILGIIIASQIMAASTLASEASRRAARQRSPTMERFWSIFLAICHATPAL